MDYKALEDDLPRLLPQDELHQALCMFILESWGKPPTSVGVVKSPRRIEKVATNEAPALGGLFGAFSAANSDARVDLS